MGTVKIPTDVLRADAGPALQNIEKINRAKTPDIAAVADSTELKKDWEYIRHLVAIIEYSDDAIISKSIDGIIKSWNKGSEKMFGYTAKQVIGKHISLIIPPEYAGEEKKIVERILTNETIEHYETVRTKKNGDQFYVSLTVSPMKDEAGNITGVSKIIRDITSQKNTEKELIHVNNKLAFENQEKEKRSAELLIANKDLKISEARLKEVNNELESFSYSVSHDLRAPLRAINGYTRMLKERYTTQLDPEADRLMNNILNNATKMGHLIDDLLNFSRVGRKELVKINVDMHYLVTAICTELKNEQRDRNIEFHINELPPAQADNIAIKQVWLNLISNAVKYSKLKDIAIIEIGAEIKEGETIYYIKDNGAGFDMRYADKLFGVFQRLHSDDEFEGTGVGLALVQRIIAKHGGRVWAEAKVNEGASFYFTLNKS